MIALKSSEKSERVKQPKAYPVAFFKTDIFSEGRDPNSGKSPYFVEYNELPQFTDDLLDGMAAVIREQEQIFESYQNPDILPMIYDNEQVMDRWNGDIDDMVRQDGRRQRGPVFRNPLPGENVNQNDSSSLLGNEEGPEIEEETPEVPPMIAGLDSRHPRMHLGVPDARAVADKREFWFLLARRLFLIPNKEKRLPPLENLSDLSMGRPPRLNRPETLTIEMEPDIHVCRTIGHLSLDDDIGLRDYDEHPQQGEDPRQHQDNDQEENKVVDNDAPVEEGAIAVMLQASEGEYARVKEENVRVARAAAALEERRQQAGVNAGPPGGYVPKKKQGKLNEFLKETTGRIQLSRDGIREGEGQGQVARNHGEAVNVGSHEGASGRAILGQNQILVISDDEDAARNIEISSGHDLSKSFMEEDQEKEEKDKKKD